MHSIAYIATPTQCLLRPSDYVKKKASGRWLCAFNISLILATLLTTKREPQSFPNRVSSNSSTFFLFVFIVLI